MKNNQTKGTVVPINRDFVRDKPDVAYFDWGMDVDATEVDQNPPSSNVALNAKITDISLENTAESASKALEGSSKTKWTATNKNQGYLFIDIGKEKTVRRWRVE